jgi:hypothetical protein
MTPFPARLKLVPRTAEVVMADLPATLASLALDEAASLSLRAWRAAVCDIVFAYWAARFVKPRALLDPKRVLLILARLRESGDQASDLLWALDGARRDPWVMGTDPRALGRHDGIEQLFRDRGTVERYAERMPGFAAATPHPLVDRYPPLHRQPDHQEAET